MLLSTVLVGRMWCGLMCPEGALTEAVSKYSLGRSIPHWVRWSGWPFVAFAATTIYGQMISVYQYPGPALVILGFSTVAAIATALMWGRNKRVWCRFLCPVSGVFAVLAKLAPLHFRVDTKAWDGWKKPHGAASIGELRAAGADPPDEGRQRLPHVRPLQLLSRRGEAGAAFAEPRDRPRRGPRDQSGADPADPVRTDGRRRRARFTGPAATSISP